MALVMVLGSLSILMFMLAEFQDTASSELQSAMASRDQLRAEYAARSAVNLSRLILAAEPTVRLPITQVLKMLNAPQMEQIPIWKFAGAILGAFGDTEGASEFASLSGLSLTETKNLGLEGAGFRLEIVDEDAMLSLNQAAHADAFSQMRQAKAILTLIGGAQYNDFFSGLDSEGQSKDRQSICGAIVDWTDPDTNLNACDPTNTNAQGSAGEDSYYQSLKKPYQRKNAAFDSLEELRLVRGIDDDFWDTFVMPDPDRNSSRVVTVWSSGKVNVASSQQPQVLLATACLYAEPTTPLCSDPVIQAQFLSIVGMATLVTGGSLPLFPSSKAFIAALKGQGQLGPLMAAQGIPPIQLKAEGELEKVITAKSQVFSVYATGYVKTGKVETKARVHAVVDMRGAPPPGSALTGGNAAAAAAMNAGNSAAASGSGAAQASGTGAVSGSTDLNFANLPRPGGVILYYRVD